MKNDEPYVTPADDGPAWSNRVLDIYVPDPANRKPDMPVVLYVHGGAYTGGCENAPGVWNFPATSTTTTAPSTTTTLVGAGTLECLDDAIPTSSRWSPVDYVDMGAVVVSVRYRLATGDGVPGGDHVLHADQVEDIDRAVRWIRNGGIEAVTDDVDVDVDKLVVWGWSAGANLAAQQALGLSGDQAHPEIPDRLILFAAGYEFTSREIQDQFQSVIDPFIGRGDIKTYDFIFDCSPEEPGVVDPSCQAVLENESLVHESKRDAIADFPPTWIAHGEDDGLVPSSESVKLWYVLGLAGRPYSFGEPADVDHDMVDQVTKRLPQCVHDQVRQAIFDWPATMVRQACL